jgi:hypothetical protein
LSNKSLTQVQHRPEDSHFWAGLMKAKAGFLACGTFKVHNGENVRFWKNVWLGDKPLSEAYPTLLRIVKRKDDTVAKVLRSIPLNISFRRGLINANRIAWFDLVSRVVEVSLTNGQDVFRWSLTKNGLFMVRPCIQPSFAMVSALTKALFGN